MTNWQDRRITTGDKQEEKKKSSFLITHRHEQSTQKQHENKVGSPPPKAILFEKPAISHEKIHMKDELEREFSKKEKVGQQSPDLTIMEN